MIRKLKVKIFEMKQVMPHEQKLTYNGKVMAEGFRRVAEWGLQKAVNPTIFLVLNPNHKLMSLSRVPIV